MNRLILPILCFLFSASMGHATGHFFPKNFGEKTVTLDCPPPSNLSAINITATSAKLKWDVVGDALGGYQVQIRIAGTAIWAALPASTNFLILQNLLPATTYQWQVKSICDPGGDGGDFSDILNFTTLQTTSNCTKPVDLSTTNITSNSAQLNWNPVAGAASYEVQLRLANDPNWISFPANAPPFIAQNLAIFTVYKWRVRAICSNTSVSDWSIEKEFKTLEQAATCPKPEGLNAINVTQNSAKFTWSAVAGAIAYQIDYQVVGSSNWTSLTSTTNWVVANNLTPNTQYFFRVRAKCDGQIFSDWSNLEDFKTLPASLDCPKPVDLSVTNITATSAQFSWAPVAGALGYEVNYALAGTTSWQSVFVTNGAATIVVNNLMPFTAYIWRVRAKCDGSIFSDWSVIEDFKTLENNTNSCPKPVDLVATNISQTTAQLSWNAVLGALAYEVNYAVAGTTNWQSVFVTAPAVSIVINNLAPQTTYIWRVRAKCDGQIFSDWSVVKEFKTLANSNDCPKPVDLAVSNITQTSAQFSWNPVASALGYEVNYAVGGTSNWVSVFVAAPASSVVINNLLPGTNYIWRVRAKCDGQIFSDWSAVKEFKTLAGGGDCVAPHEFAVKNVTHHSALLVWNKVPAALGYEIQIRKVGTTVWSTFFVTGNPPPAQFLADNLVPEMDYEWRVRTKCDGQIFSDWGPTQIFMTLPEPDPNTPCPVPADFHVDQATHYSAKFSWNAAPGAFSYQITYRLAGTNVWKTINVTGNPLPTMFLLLNLSPNTNYEAKIRSHCGVDTNSDWSPVVTFKTLEAPPCSTPSDLQSNNITFFSAALSWSAVPGATSYRVRYRKFGTQNWKTKTITGTPPATMTTVSPLPANSTIEWQVRAFCGTGSEGDWSPLATFQTPAAPPCDAPTGFVFTDLTASSAKISWVGPSGAISYKIRYRKISPNGQPGPWKIKTITGTPPATTTMVDGLLPETIYEVQGITFCGPASQSFWSATATFNTPPQFEDPNPPSDFLNKKTSWSEPIISPNPTSDFTQIRFESTEDGFGELMLFDLNGKLVFKTQLAVNQGFNEIDLSLGEIPTGIYMMRLQGGKQVFSEKIQVVR